MSKMNQVIQIGEIEGNIYYYIEDYVYTYLKKQENSDIKKYFLYGEKEETHEKTKLYIYGIGQKPRMEQTYFKDYYPLGFLKIKDNKKYWVNLNGQENIISGFYIFYAPNQAMQEYLVDYHKEEKREDKSVDNSKKRFPVEMPSMKETIIPVRKVKNKNIKKENEFIRVSVGGIIIAFLLLIVLTSANGRNKLNIFKQVIKETMSNTVKKYPEEGILIEEKKVGVIEKDLVLKENLESVISREEEKTESEKNINIQEVINDEIKNNQEKEIKIIKEDVDKLQTEFKREEKQKEKLIAQTEESEIIVEENKDDISKKTIYEEYIVQSGDTLVAICKKRYNSLLKMKEICNLNGIKNADYIAPGQKLYLPR